MKLPFELALVAAVAALTSATMVGPAAASPGGDRDLPVTSVVRLADVEAAAQKTLACGTSHGLATGEAHYVNGLWSHTFSLESDGDDLSELFEAWFTCFDTHYIKIARQWMGVHTTRIAAEITCLNDHGFAIEAIDDPALFELNLDNPEVVELCYQQAMAGDAP